MERKENAERLTLEPVASHHAGEMFPVLADPALYRFTGGEPPGNAASVRRWFSNLETRKSPDGTESWLTWIVRLNEKNAAIGYVQATIKGMRANTAWLIGTDWQGHGYAGQAVALLKSMLTDRGIEQLTAYIHPDHRASQQVATGAGFIRSGGSHEGEEIWVASLDPR